MRNIEALRNYFLGKDPMLKETLADNSLRLIGIEGKHFVLRTELIQRLKELKDTLDKEDKRLQDEIDDLVQEAERLDNKFDNYVNIQDFEDTIENYYTKSQVDALLEVIPRFSIEVVQELPTQDISPTVIYLVPGTNDNPLDVESNYYDEYIYANNTWELVGTTQIDMSDYYTKEEVNAKAFFTTITEDWTIPEDGPVNPLTPSGWYYTGTHYVNISTPFSEPLAGPMSIFYYSGGEPEDQFFHFVPVNIQDMQNQLDARLWYDTTEQHWQYAGYGVAQNISSLNPNVNLDAMIPTVQAVKDYVSTSITTITDNNTKIYDLDVGVYKVPAQTTVLYGTNPLETLPTTETYYLIVTSRLTNPLTDNKRFYAFIGDKIYYGGAVKSSVPPYNITGFCRTLTLIDGTPEDSANKKTTIDSSSTDTDYPSAKAVWDLLDSFAQTNNLNMPT